jgi:hypothetical protein
VLVEPGSHRKKDDIEILNDKQRDQLLSRSTTFSLFRLQPTSMARPLPGAHVHDREFAHAE